MADDKCDTVGCHSKTTESVDFEGRVDFLDPLELCSDCLEEREEKFTRI